MQINFEKRRLESGWMKVHTSFVGFTSFGDHFVRRKTLFTRMRSEIASSLKAESSNLKTSQVLVVSESVER